MDDDEMATWRGELRQIDLELKAAQSVLDEIERAQCLEIARTRVTALLGKLGE